MKLFTDISRGVSNAVDFVIFKEKKYSDHEYLDKLEQQNAILREALEFYANTNSWDAESDGDGYTWSYFVEGIIDKDDLIEPWCEQGIKTGGKRARMALKQVGE